ncbi:hypothetical protein JCM11491_004223 [Sporobolomyces phaffii]
MTRNALLSTTAALVVLQLGSRVFSFALNQVLLRSTSPHAFGVATIQFDTLRDTVLFLLREGIRGAVVRTRSTKTTNGSRLVVERQSRLIPALCWPLVVPVFYLFSRASASASRDRDRTLLLYAASTVIELWSEPMYLATLAEWERLTPTRVRIEGLAVVTKALATLVALRRGGGALEAYGWGQVTYALTLLIGLGFAVRTRTTATATDDDGWGLQKSEDGRYFDRDVVRLGWALTKQSAVKQVLTEGDKLAVARFGRADDLAGYAVALNYGSLVARIVFQPIEESSRLYFSSLSASASSGRRERLGSLESMSEHLSHVLMFYAHLSLVLTLLAPAYVAPAVQVVLGARWSDAASRTLTAYVYSLPFLAVNGVLEAAVQSVADDRGLRLASAWMGVCTVAFAATVAATLGRGGQGSVGLVVANCVAMALRIVFSSWYLWRYFRTELDRDKDKDNEEEEEEEEEGARRRRVWENLSPVASWGPSGSSVVAFGMGSRVVEASRVRAAGGGVVAHFATGAVVGVACLAVVAWSNRTRLGAAVTDLARRRRTKVE